MIKTVIVLCLFVFNSGEKKIEGWYHKENIAECLKSKRFAERNAGITNLYTCSIEQCVMKTDQTGVEHCDKIITK